MCVKWKMRVNGMNGKALSVLAMAMANVAAAAAPLQVGDVLHGFKVTAITGLPDVQGRLVRMTYGKNGADLAWLDRADDNKTFAIGFRTFPSDDTGVPHIIEHSVLCGSEKYPVKEPFVDLLKSSFQTFLNAWTSADSTMYPVCSRNDADFRNLVDVYMDAVFHPLSVKSPMAFRQEGWHYEIDAASGELKRNGVVYSEMKGAFANPERLMYHEKNRLLYPDTCYRFVSGGDPAAIPSLTFEGYKAFYERFYHPSNARIFLDGSVDIDGVLAQLDGYLKAFGRADVDARVAYQRPVFAAKTMEYEIGAAENPDGKVLMCDAWVFGRFDEREKLMAMDAIADAVADSNEAPLSKALLEKGLCEDVRFGVGSQAQLEAMLVVKNAKAENVEKIRAVAMDVFRRLADGGLDRRRISAILDRAEFRDRERGSASTPRGLEYFCEAYDVWLYGGDPADAFRNSERYASLRKKLAEGWFEKVLREAIVENGHHVSLTMTPSTTLGERHRAEDKAELERIKGGWTKDELDRVVAEAKALADHQNAPDRPEDVAKLPVLSVKDVPLRGPERTHSETAVDGVKVLRPRVGATGVAHLELHFSVADFSDEDLAALPSLSLVLGDLATEKYEPQALKNELDAGLGRFSTDAAVHGRLGDPGAAHPYFVVRASMLDAKKDEAVRLVPEVLLRTKFSDTKAVGNLVKQMRIAYERATAGIGGRNFAFRRAAAQVSARGRVEDLLGGFAQMRHLQSVDAKFASDGEAYCRRLADLAARVFTRRRMTVFMTDNVPADWTRALSAAFPAGAPAAAPAARSPLPKRGEGFTTTAKIAFAAKVAHPAKSLYGGTAVVAARVLSLDYLWDEIRVKGGAYGGSFRVRPDGDAGWLSWNDPAPARSLDVYDGCAKALRAFADGPEALDRYIVSSVAATEPYQTPREELSDFANLVLSGRTPEDRQRLRAEMLRTTKERLRAFADEVAALPAQSAVCVLGGVPLVQSCSNAVEAVESVVPAKGE